ncbi:MAG TPA: ClpXP protease specificity-enhancing factor [Gammaproteobacteria bacterium]
MSSGKGPSSQRPYLIRAMHEWMVDNGYTPHLVVDAARAGGGVPAEHVKDGKIVLNVSYSATRNLAIGNERIEFEARFGGVPRRLDVPVESVLCIYARETGQGMIFSMDPPPPDQPPDPGAPDPNPPEPGPPDGPPRLSRPKLTVVR